MVSSNNTNGSYDPVVQPFVEFWSGYVKQANDATRDLLSGIEDQSNIKTWQRRWFDTVSKSVDAYLRSPNYLQLMKQNTDGAVKLKRQTDDILAEVARNANIPTAADISGLFERLHSAEEGILTRLNHIDGRLQQIESKIVTAEFAKS